MRCASPRAVATSCSRCTRPASGPSIARSTWPCRPIKCAGFRSITAPASCCRWWTAQWRRVARHQRHAPPRRAPHRVHPLRAAGHRAGHRCHDSLKRRRASGSLCWGWPSPSPAPTARPSPRRARGPQRPQQVDRGVVSAGSQPGRARASHHRQGHAHLDEHVVRADARALVSPLLDTLDDKTVFLRSPFGAGRSGDRDWGYIDVSRLVVRELGPDDLWARAARHSPGDPDDQTDIVVPLPAEVAPGATLHIDFEWQSRLPSIVERTGYSGSFHLLGHWFRPARARRPLGRLTHPQAEFYADFGSYAGRAGRGSWAPPARSFATSAWARFHADAITTSPGPPSPDFRERRGRNGERRRSLPLPARARSECGGHGRSRRLAPSVSAGCTAPTPTPRSRSCIRPSTPATPVG